MYGVIAARTGEARGRHQRLDLLDRAKPRQPSVSSLKKVLDGIPMALADFFTLDLGGQPQVFFPRQDLSDIGTGSVELRLVGSRLAKRSNAILHERYAPGADTGEEMLTHAGEEGGVIVKGRIELTVGGEARILGPGDAYYFKSSLPHRFRNLAREECEIVSASTPPSFERWRADLRSCQ